MTSEQGDVTISKSLLRQLFGELKDELAQSIKVLIDEFKQELLSAIKISECDGNVPGFATDGSAESPDASRASCQQATIPVPNSQTLHYHNQLKKNNDHWKLAKNSDLESFLSCRLSFVSLCKKKCPDLDTMRELLLNPDGLDEEDYDGFTSLIASIKNSKDESGKRLKWLSFLRALCKPHFNRQDPTITGSNPQVYEQRVELIADKVIEYLFERNDYRFVAKTTKYGHQKCTYVHQITSNEIVREIYAIHGNRVDNEVRYLKSIVGQEFPDGKVAVQRRNKKTKLVNVLVLGKVNGEKEEGDDEEVGSSLSQSTVSSVEAATPSKARARVTTTPKVRTPSKETSGLKRQAALLDQSDREGLVDTDSADEEETDDETIAKVAEGVARARGDHETVDEAATAQLRSKFGMKRPKLATYIMKDGSTMREIEEGSYVRVGTNSAACEVASTSSSPDLIASLERIKLHNALYRSPSSSSSSSSSSALSSTASIHQAAPVPTTTTQFEISDDDDEEEEDEEDEGVLDNEVEFDKGPVVEVQKDATEDTTTDGTDDDLMSLHPSKKVMKEQKNNTTKKKKKSSFVDDPYVVGDDPVATRPGTRKSAEVAKQKIVEKPQTKKQRYDACKGPPGAVTETVPLVFQSKRGQLGVKAV